MRLLLIILIICLCMLNISCAYCKGTLFIGWGEYKDKEVEIKSNSPIKDIVNVSGISN